jgi:Zn-dependent protease
MGMDIRTIIIAAPVIVFSLTVHEFFHAYLAYRFGDPTAKDMGRLTLNPLAHLDLFGTLVMVMSGFRFGWAKPVPVNPYNLRHRRADLWISAAGPLSNFGLAFISGTIFRVMAGADLLGRISAIDHILMQMVLINVFLAFFNLLPMFPLDGSHILRNLLPDEMGPTVDQIERFAPMVLLFLIVGGAMIGIPFISIILLPFVRPVVYLFSGLSL